MQAHSTSREDSRQSVLGGILAGLFAGNRDRSGPWAAAPSAARHADPSGAEEASLLKRQYPIRIRLGLPAGGGGAELAQLRAWLTEKAGPDGWALAGTGSGRSHSLALYLIDPMLIADFVARWCATDRVEAAEGVFRIRDAAPPIQLAGRRPRKPQPTGRSLASAAA